MADEERVRVRELLHGYELRDVYNFDETSLFWRQVPTRGYAASLPAHSKESSRARIGSLWASAVMRTVVTSVLLYSLGNLRSREHSAESPPTITASNTGATRRRGSTTGSLRNGFDDSTMTCASRVGRSSCLWTTFPRTRRRLSLSLQRMFGQSSSRPI